MAQHSFRSGWLPVSMAVFFMLAACSKEPLPSEQSDSGEPAKTLSSLAELQEGVAEHGDTAALAEDDVAAAEVEEPEVLVEPTESEMYALIDESIEAINRNGGIRIQMSGVQSKPIMMKLEGFRKTGCTPYTRAFRCEGETTMSYPGTDFPRETLRHSQRYQKDDQGRWTMG